MKCESYRDQECGICHGEIETGDTMHFMKEVGAICMKCAAESGYACPTPGCDSSKKPQYEKCYNCAKK